jgi:hypothetical protein
MLLFPVKLGLELPDVLQEIESPALGASRRHQGRNRWRVGVWAGLLGWALLGCGYQPVYGASAQRYEVVAGRSGSASFEALSAVTAGVRSELGAAEALGSGFPRVVVEVLRVDERSIGVRAAAGATPLARGSEIVVVGRARVLAAADAAPAFDSGDMSRSVQFAAGTSATADAASRSRAVRDAARILGQALGRAVLGLPEPQEG